MRFCLPLRGADTSPAPFGGTLPRGEGIADNQKDGKPVPYIQHTPCLRRKR